MKKSSAILLANVVLVSFIGGNVQVNCETKKASPKKTSTVVPSKKVNVTKYKDGTFEGKFTHPDTFYCKAKITIKNNKITNVVWHIYDSKNKVFDEKYENVYQEELYKEQCRNELKDDVNYAPALIKKQDVQKVDAVSGATWSNNLFKEAVKAALKKARK